MSKKLTAWRAVHPDLRSSNGFRWPFPGKKAVAPLPEGQTFTRLIGTWLAGDYEIVPLKEP